MSTRFRVISHISDGSHTREYTRSLVNSERQIPKIAFKQYIPLENLHPKEGDVTIIAGHANGIPKETYEPLWEEILARSKREGFEIRGIWIADCYNQGESGILNEDILGNDPCWSDHARDLLHFVNTHRHEMPQPLVGIGHSLGASQLQVVHLTTIHPALFKLLVFIEPGFHATNPGFKAARPTLNRRDRWPSEQVAAEEFRASKFYGIWDQRCLDLFVKHGLRESPAVEQKHAPEKRANEVILKTTKHQELATLMRPVEDAKANTPGEGLFNRPEAITLFQRLPDIRPPLLYLFGEKSGTWSGSKAEIISASGTSLIGNGGRRVGKVETWDVEGGTHFVPLEKPYECAKQIAMFLGRGIKQWLAEEERIQKEWRGKSRVEQTAANEIIVKALNLKPKEKL